MSDIPGYNARISGVLPLPSGNLERISGSPARSVCNYSKAIHAGYFAFVIRTAENLDWISVSPGCYERSVCNLSFLPLTSGYLEIWKGYPALPDIMLFTQ